MIAGRYLSSQYLAAWLITQLEGIKAARRAIHYVTQVGEKEICVTHAIANISPSCMAEKNCRDLMFSSRSIDG